jgi:hypothetical protein
LTSFNYAFSVYTFLFRSVKQCLPTAAMPVHKNANCYNMNHKNRGKCIIFNHEEFDFLELAKREGTTYDTLRLQKTFGNLDFDIEIHDNLTHSQIMDVIEEGKDNICHISYDLLIFSSSRVIRLSARRQFFLHISVDIWDQF